MASRQLPAGLSFQDSVSQGKFLPLHDFYSIVNVLHQMVYWIRCSLFKEATTTKVFSHEFLFLF